MSQNIYAKGLIPLPTCSDFDSFRSLRHKLAWIGHMRPNFVAPVNILSQVTDKRFDAQHIRLINSFAKRVKSSGEWVLMQHCLDMSGLRLVVYSVSSFPNNYDSLTQLGFIIFLTDHTGRANCLHFSSYKSKRIVRSVLGG